MRRALTIFAIVLLLAGIGGAIYYFFFAGSASLTTTPGIDLPVAGEGTPFVPDEPGTAGGTTGTPVVVSSRLVKITAGPAVPGAVILNTKPVTASSSGETVVQYIGRSSGNVFSYNTASKTLTRVSNKTIPGIASAAWLPDGSTAYVRYLSGEKFTTINTYALVATSTDKGFFLPQGLADIAVSAGGILMLASGVNGSVASTAHRDGTSSVTAFTTPLSALRASFAGKSQYLAYTKASGALPGSAFLVDSTGHFSRIAGPNNGLVALASPSGKWALVSSTAGSAIQLSLVNTATGEFVALPVATIADKCVWAADDSAVFCGIPVNPPTSALYPDDWYQGAVHFSDRIWKIQVDGRYAQLVLDFPKETKDSLDAQSLAVDPAGTTLVFVNKNDGSLWGYSL